MARHCAINAILFEVIHVKKLKTSAHDFQIKQCQKSIEMLLKSQQQNVAKTSYQAEQI